MSKRYFTVEEANSLVPRLEGAIFTVLQLRAQLHRVSDELDTLGEPLSADSFLQGGGAPRVLAARGRARALVETITESIAEIDSLGVEVKDLDAGLCDFISRCEGREVYLCWKLGEKRVEHWHELGSGFGGRLPLDGNAEAVFH